MLPELVTCSQCEAVVKAILPDGDKVRCPRCGGVLVVAPPGAEADEVAAVETRRRGLPRRRFPVWIFALAAGLILGELALAAVWSWAGSR
jgi:hypothetical protein